MAEDDPQIEALRAKAAVVAGRLSLMADPRRLMILCRLAEGEASAGALAEHVGLGQSALGRHLARLREAGVVATRREAQAVFYRFDDPETRRLMDALYDVFCAPDR
ncbi:MAG: metalloregulator ArsR/SmtB family transcription factor [Paracoccaceae bacterium]